MFHQVFICGAAQDQGPESSKNLVLGLNNVVNVPQTLKQETTTSSNTVGFVQTENVEMAIEELKSERCAVINNQILIKTDNPVTKVEQETKHFPTVISCSSNMVFPVNQTGQTYILSSAAGPAIQPLQITPSSSCGPVIIQQPQQAAIQPLCPTFIYQPSILQPQPTLIQTNGNGVQLPSLSVPMQAGSVAVPVTQVINTAQGSTMVCKKIEPFSLKDEANMRISIENLEGKKTNCQITIKKEEPMEDDLCTNISNSGDVEVQKGAVKTQEHIGTSNNSNLGLMKPDMERKEAMPVCLISNIGDPVPEVQHSQSLSKSQNDFGYKSANTKDDWLRSKYNIRECRVLINSSITKYTTSSVSIQDNVKNKPETVLQECEDSCPSDREDECSDFQSSSDSDWEEDYFGKLLRNKKQVKVKEKIFDELPIERNTFQVQNSVKTTIKNIGSLHFISQNETKSNLDVQEDTSNHTQTYTQPNKGVGIINTLSPSTNPFHQEENLANVEGRESSLEILSLLPQHKLSTAAISKRFIKKFLKSSNSFVTVKKIYNPGSPMITSSCSKNNVPSSNSILLLQNETTDKLKSSSETSFKSLLKTILPSSTTVTSSKRDTSESNSTPYTNRKIKNQFPLQNNTSNNFAAHKPVLKANLNSSNERQFLKLTLPMKPPVNASIETPKCVTTISNSQDFNNKNPAQSSNLTKTQVRDPNEKTHDKNKSLNTHEESKNDCETSSEDELKSQDSFYCKKCNKFFYSEGKFNTHIKYSLCGDHRRESKHQCTICGKGFGSRDKREAHENSHTNARPFKCFDCDKCFNSKAARQMHHSNMHLNKKTRYLCYFCGYISPSSEHMLAHEEAHRLPEGAEIPKPFKCLDCGKGFISRWQQIRHKREHLLKKCMECTEKFKTKGQLVNHMEAVHSIIKTYKCKECDKQFRSSDALKNHRKIHSSVLLYFCDDCDKGFKRKNNLLQHMITHSDERPILCPDCGDRFKRITHLKQHTAACHGDGRKG